MWAYAATRVMWLIPTLLGVSLIIFVLLHISPGDPATVLVSIEAGDAELAEARKELGLDRALPIQYGIWLGRVLRGDLGRSYARRTEVRKDLTGALKNTLILAATSAVLVVVVGVALGTIAAFSYGGVIDRAVTAVAIFGLAVPSFWLAILLIIVFSVQATWLPPSGIQSPVGGGDWIDIAKHLVLPSIALAASGIGVLARFVRTSILDIVGQEFVVALDARGLRRPRVIVHVVKNAAPPIITLMGLQFAGLLGGSVLVETVFTYPGSGWLLNLSIAQRDSTVILGAVLVLACFYVLINLFVDLSQALIDPRIRRG